MITEDQKKLIEGPVNLGGAIGRIVELPDGTGQVETWGADGWEPGGADVFSIAVAQDASPAILRKYRVPEEFWSDIVLEEDRLAREKKRGG